MSYNHVVSPSYLLPKKTCEQEISDNALAWNPPRSIINNVFRFPFT